METNNKVFPHISGENRNDSQNEYSNIISESMA